MIRKAREVVGDIFDAGRMAYDRDRDEFAMRVITADRLAISEWLREHARVTPMSGEEYVRLNDAADRLESELRQAGEDKHDE